MFWFNDPHIGTPTTPGSYAFAIGVTDSTKAYAERDFIIEVTEELRITTASPLTRGTVGVSYFQSFQASGGDQPFTFTQSGGLLPSGLSLSFSGSLSGTPSSSGAFDFTLTVRDDSGRTADKSFHLEVVNLLSISNNQPDNGIVGTPYNLTLTASGGYGAYYWAIYTGITPKGLSFTNGVLSGTPTEATYGTLVFAVTDDENRLAFRDVTIQIGDPLQILTTSLPNGLINEPYSEAIRIKGGIGPFWFSYTGQLSGLSLNSSTGIFSGKPTIAGVSNATVTVTDSTYPTTQTKTQNLSFRVVNTLTILTSAVFPQGKIGVTMNPVVLSAKGGPSPYKWQIAGGQLPDGVTLNSQTGEITGTPSGKGDFMFTVQVIDVNNATSQKEFSWHVSGSLSIVTGAVPDAVKGKPYNFTLEAKDGLPPYQWRIKSGALPSGLSFNIGTGTIYGTPTTRQTYSFTVEVNDSDSPAQKAEHTYIIDVLDTLYIYTQSAPNGRINQAYTTTFGAELGVPPYTWRKASGIFPAGLTFTGSSTTATLAGTPTTVGTFAFSLEVSDTGTPVKRVEKEFTITIYGIVKIATTGVKSAIKGQPYSDSLVATGGTLPYQWQKVGGSLPTGLELNSTSGHIYGAPSLTTGQSSTFKVRVTDAGSPSGFDEEEYTLFAIDPLAITTQTIQKAMQGSAYQAMLSGTGGISPYHWRVSAGSLPGGITLNPDTGVLSGSSVPSGIFDFTVELKDSASVPNSITHAYQLEVLPCSSCPIPTPTPTPTPGPKLIINQIDANSCSEIKSIVAVTNMSGNPVSGLTASDFTVTENSINQSPITVKPVSSMLYSPVTVALTMDYSGSMNGQPVIDIQNAAAAFITQMGSGDQGEIIKFSDSVSVVQPFTTDKTLLASVAKSDWAGAGGRTALYDSIYQAVADTARQGGRMAVIAMTGSYENASSYRLDDIINFAKRSGVPVFTVGLGSVEENGLNRIATETGGAYYYAPASSDLLAIYQKIAMVINNQYIVTYSTLQSDGLDHTAVIKATENGVSSMDSKTFTACMSAIPDACTAMLSSDFNFHIPTIVYQTSVGPAYILRTGIICTFVLPPPAGEGWGWGFKS